MALITILNRCHGFPGFVYQHARFSPDKKSIKPLLTMRAFGADDGNQTARLRRG